MTYNGNISQWAMNDTVGNDRHCGIVEIGNDGQSSMNYNSE